MVLESGRSAGVARSFGVGEVAGSNPAGPIQEPHYFPLINNSTTLTDSAGVPTFATSPCRAATVGKARLVRHSLGDGGSFGVGEVAGVNAGTYFSLVQKIPRLRPAGPNLSFDS